MRFTNKMKQDGELAVRKMSAKAQRYYKETDPLTVYEYDDESFENKLYAYTDADGTRTGLTLEQIEKEFESLVYEEDDE